MPRTTKKHDNAPSRLSRANQVAIAEATQEARLVRTPGWQKFQQIVAGFSIYSILTSKGKYHGSKHFPDIGYLLLLEHSLGKPAFRQLCPLALPTDHSLAKSVLSSNDRIEDLVTAPLMQDRSQLASVLWHRFCQLQRRRAKQLWPQGIGNVIHQTLKKIIPPVLPRPRYWEFCEAYLKIRFGLYRARPVKKIKKLIKLTVQAFDFDAANGNSLALDCATLAHRTLKHPSVTPYLSALAKAFSEKESEQWSKIAEAITAASGVNNTPDFSWDTPLAELLSVRVANRLEEERGYQTFCDLRGVTETDLEAIRNLGSSGIGEIKCALGKISRAIQTRQQATRRRLKQEKRLVRQHQN